MTKYKVGDIIDIMFAIPDISFFQSGQTTFTKFINTYKVEKIGRKYYHLSVIKVDIGHYGDRKYPIPIVDKKARYNPKWIKDKICDTIRQGNPI